MSLLTVIVEGDNVALSVLVHHVNVTSCLSTNLLDATCKIADSRKVEVKIIENAMLS